MFAWSSAAFGHAIPSVVALDVAELVAEIDVEHEASLKSDSGVGSGTAASTVEVFSIGISVGESITGRADVNVARTSFRDCAG